MKIIDQVEEVFFDDLWFVYRGFLQEHLSIENQFFSVPLPVPNEYDA